MLWEMLKPFETSIICYISPNYVYSYVKSSEWSLDVSKLHCLSVNDLRTSILNFDRNLSTGAEWLKLLFPAVTWKIQNYTWNKIQMFEHASWFNFIVVISGYCLNMASQVLEETKSILLKEKCCLCLSTMAR